MSARGRDAPPARGRPDRGRAPLVLGAAAFACAVPFLCEQLAGGRFLLHVLVTFLVSAVVAQAWNLVLGFGGIHSFAQLAFYGVGGYTTAVLTMRLGVHPVVGLALGPCAAAVAAIGIGLPALRLRGVYVVLLTLAFHELLRTFVINGPALVSNGGFGLLYVPRLVPPGTFSAAGEAAFHYYGALGLFAAASAFIWALLRSPVGLAFQALRDAETYAGCRGVDFFRYRLLLFASSAFLAGLAGAFFTQYQGAISPGSLGFGPLVNLLAMIVVGGWGTFAGPIVGAGLLTVLPEVFQGLGDYKTLAFGAALVASAVLAPQGIVAIVARRAAEMGRVWRAARG